MRPAIALVSGIASIALLGLAGCGGNPDTPAGRAADARHKSFETMGDAFKRAGDEMKKDEPDMGEIQVSAKRIADLAPKLPGWFPTGSGPDDGMHTEALQAVWTKPDEFRAAAQKFADEAAKFDTAAKAGDKAAVGAAMQSLGGACKGCHEKFREDD